MTYITDIHDLDPPPKTLVATFIMGLFLGLLIPHMIDFQAPSPDTNSINDNAVEEGVREAVIEILPDGWEITYVNNPTHIYEGWYQVYVEIVKTNATPPDWTNDFVSYNIKTKEVHADFYF